MTRGYYDMARSERVIALCTRPYTAAEIRDALRDQRAPGALYNLVKRGQLVNLHAGWGPGARGLFVAKAVAEQFAHLAVKPADKPARPARRIPCVIESPEFDASALVAVWR